MHERLYYRAPVNQLSSISSIIADAMRHLDFDTPDDWWLALDTHLRRFATIPSEGVDSAHSFNGLRALLRYALRASDERLVAAAARDFVSACTVQAYHATRLTDDEVHSVRTQGLLPLKCRSRRSRIANALCAHRDWPKAQLKLDLLLDDCEQGRRRGKREGEVCFFISQTTFQQAWAADYFHGPEVDRDIAHDLLGNEGAALVRGTGRPHLVTVRLPGVDAIDGAHTNGDVEQTMRVEVYPNLVSDFLEVWAMRLYSHAFDGFAQTGHTGISIRRGVAPNDILLITPVPDE